MDFRAEERDIEPPRVAIFKWESSMQGNDVEQERSHNHVPMKQGYWICFIVKRNLQRGNLILGSENVNRVSVTTSISEETWYI
ncbi:Hypothetical predicted protein [Olea europaea subsp. europaea]|uniref:Uncharacterized protein n=1 Tax=Olea europaea subsp. europaea TaxID=158383 RepID=A0A8S0PQU1_OLEEU|nr:Hypothetical predicted protein [Olea europaea subsp. europaea]